MTTKQVLLEELNDRELSPVVSRVIGSQLTGVAHEDSGLDVGVVFRQPGHYYAGGGNYRQNIHVESGEIDIMGWNVDRFAELLRESNPTVVEFLQSDKAVTTDVTGVLDDIENMMMERANRMALYHHYRSLAEANYQKYFVNDNDRTKKRAFYVIRAIEMARHIRETNEVPPVNVSEFLGSTSETAGVEYLDYLAREKRDGNGDEGVSVRLTEFVEPELSRDPEPTDERTINPSEWVIDRFITQAI